MNKGKGRRGQGVAEWALILPIFMLFLFGLIDVSFAFSQKHSINQLSRDLARQASVGHSLIELQNTAKTEAKAVMDVKTISYEEIVESGLTISKFTVTSETNTMIIKFTPSLRERVKGKDLAVTVQYSYQPLTPFLDVLTKIPLDAGNHTLIEMNASN